MMKHESIWDSPKRNFAKIRLRGCLYEGISSQKWTFLQKRFLFCGFLLYSACVIIARRKIHRTFHRTFRNAQLSHHKGTVNKTSEQGNRARFRKHFIVRRMIGFENATKKIATGTFFFYTLYIFKTTTTT